MKKSRTQSLAPHILGIDKWVNPLQLWIHNSRKAMRYWAPLGIEIDFREGHKLIYNFSSELRPTRSWELILSTLLYDWFNSGTIWQFWIWTPELKSNNCSNSWQLYNLKNARFGLFWNNPFGSLVSSLTFQIDRLVKALIRLQIFAIMVYPWLMSLAWNSLRIRKWLGAMANCVQFLISNFSRTGNTIIFFIMKCCFHPFH